MNTLIIQHVPGDEPRFHVVRQRDGKRTAQPAAVRAARGFPVEGRPDSDLVRELRWYLEEFLGYPFSPETEHADRVLDALKQWGRQAFDALFDNRQAREFLAEAAPDGRYAQLHLQISADDPRILAWPWEALRDSAAGLLAQTCQIERRLNQVLDPQPLDKRLPRDRVNILLVTARPYEQDVQYRSISRPLVELIEKHQLAAHVTVLRPPTFDQLRRHLRDHPHHYHILHFDGHGGYGEAEPGTGSSQMLRGPVGCLLFEDADGKPDKITANQLSNLLRESAVPDVVLNACQSAMIDERAEDAFASVAASFLRSGTRSVVAMAYSLYVSGAQQFLPAFYERLFEAGDLAQAVRAGRQQMYSKQGRVCVRGRFPLHDWLVPVVYQQDPLDFSFAAEARKTAAPRESKLPEEARDEHNPYGFIGRDGALLALERAMLRPPAGILITGLGGVGKTTLARGFVGWLEDTDGLGHGCLWFTFTDIRNAEFVINRMGEALFGGDFSKEKMETKLDALAATLKDNRFVIVWDNFEVARDIPSTSVAANLTDQDRDLLLTLLQKLRGGASKVIITSRSREDWLSHENRFELPIGGLAGDERWDYCEAILRDLGLNPDRDDPAMIELMDLLGGHTLAMRAILPKLKEKPAVALAAALRTNLDDLDLPEDEVSAKLAATLRFVEASLPQDQRPLLIPLSLHEGFLNADCLEHIAQQVDARSTRQTIDAFIAALCVAGLLRRVKEAVYELHPALTGYLRATTHSEASASDRQVWVSAFVKTMASLADALGGRDFNDQSYPLYIYTPNFRHALDEAGRLGMHEAALFLLQPLAHHADATQDFASSAQFAAQMAEESKACGRHDGEAAGYNRLGVVALEQRDFATAEHWSRRSLNLCKKLGHERGTASACHLLGRIAQQKGDLTVARQWFRKALTILEKLGIEPYIAATYHHLGIIADEQADFADAEQWHRKSLALKEKLGDNSGIASTYNELGGIAFSQQRFAAAKQWYRHALAVFETLGIEHEAANTAQNLGMLSEKQAEFVEAEQWYRKSLVIKEKLGDERGAARIYHNLGNMAQKQRDYASAEQWYQKALLIFQRLYMDHPAAVTCHELGVIAERRRDFAVAKEWHHKSLAIKEKLSDERGTAITYHQLGRIAEEEGDLAAADQWYCKSLAIKERLGAEHLASVTYHQLGVLAQKRQDYVAAEQWYRRELAIAEKNEDVRGIALAEGALGTLAGAQERYEEASRRLIRSLRAFHVCKDQGALEQTAQNYMAFYRQATTVDRAKLRARWREAGLGELP